MVTGLKTLQEGSLPVSLKSLSLQGSPIDCNCSIVWLINALQPTNTSRINHDIPKCQSPTNLETRELLSLTAEELNCNTNKEHMIIVFSALSVAAIALLLLALGFVIWRYRRTAYISPKEKHLSHSHYFPASVYCIPEIHQEGCPSHKWPSAGADTSWPIAPNIGPGDGPIQHHHPMCHHHPRNRTYQAPHSHCPTSASADDFIYESQVIPDN